MSINKLHPDQFSDFFHAIHGYKPFPWQARLAADVFSSKGYNSIWPLVMSLPTASGKTACLDIAIFALACQADWGERRTAPRRIFFVVDRRVIVDEAYERALKIKRKLDNPEEDILKSVHDRLLYLAGEKQIHNPTPLHCFQLRGGIYRDDAWAKSPLQPAVIASTVDQIGSRLLFRSYGCSLKLAPIHAGLAGNDALIFLDEAHCSKPFMETLQAIKKYREWQPQTEQPINIQTPFHVVVMSATPPPDIKEGVFKLDQDDEVNPVLKKRFSASKPVELFDATKKKKEDIFIDKALELVSNENKAIAIIVNRVKTAKNIFSKLKDKTKTIKKLKKTDVAFEDYDFELFIGRMRPLDREKITQKWLEILNVSNSETRQLDKPVFIIATQCLEVGANLDFDAMVTECASLDALRQRFGRLNRLGRFTREGTPKISPACIIYQKVDNDPIYGNAIKYTWEWLQKQKKLDFGIRLFNELLQQKKTNLEPLLAPSRNSPIMLPAHIDCWIQTEPVPQPDPDISLFLHGPDRGVPDVQICWRADLLEKNEEKVIETLSLCSPLSSECMQVPIHAVRGWLKGKDTDTEICDVEGIGIHEEINEKNYNSDINRWLVRWQGPENSEIIDNHHEITPGDTLVIPEWLGGWDLFGYIPEKEGNSIDIAEKAYFEQKRNVILRLHRNLIHYWPEGDVKERILTFMDFSIEDDLDIQTELIECLKILSQSKEYPKGLKEIAQRITNDKSFKLIPHPFNGWLCHSHKASKLGDHDMYSTEDDLSSMSNRQMAVSLDQHSKNIADFAHSYLVGNALPTHLIDDMTLAARLHDIGKVDLRFQAWLRNGNRMLALASNKYLAKSEGLPQSWKERQLARERSGYPKGARHELLSVRLVESNPQILQSANDRDLVLHLIESHHGYCRPFAPVVEDADPVEVSFEIDGQLFKASSDTGLERLDSGVAERFWKLVRKYGWWGLAYLEALFRLSDHRSSEWEQIHFDNEMEGNKL